MIFNYVELSDRGTPLRLSILSYCLRGEGEYFIHIYSGSLLIFVSFIKKYNFSRGYYSEHSI